MLVFGKHISVRIICMFFVYNILTFVQKTLTLCKTSIFLSAFEGSFYPILSVYIVYILLPLKEILYVCAEREYVGKEVMKKHREIEKHVYAGEKEKEILYALNATVFEADLATEKAQYIQKYSFYATKIVSVIFIFVLKLRGMPLLYTAAYIIADIQIKRKVQKLFTEHRGVVLEHNNKILLMITEIEEYNRYANIEKGIEKSVNDKKNIKRMEEAYKEEEKKYKKSIYRSMIKESIFVILNTFLFNIYTVGILLHMFWFNQTEGAKYFMTMHKKLEKLSKCVLKVF